MTVADIERARVTDNDPVAPLRDWRLDSASLLPLLPGQCRHERHVLDNGLTVLLHRDDTTPLVHIGIAYRVGSMDEGPGQAGLAHFLEHMMFAGTRALPGSYMRRMLDAGATDVNAMTMRDLTRYFQTVPPHLVDFTLFAEADRMANFGDSLDPAIIEQERKVVLEEKREQEGRPLGLLHNWISSGLLPFGHPYRHPVIGHVADIEHYTRDAIADWHLAHYGPGNAVLVIAGGIDPTAMLARVRHYFGVIAPRPAPPRMEARVDGAPRQSVARVADWIDTPGLFFRTWATPSIVQSPRVHLALSLAADLLGGDGASPLRRRLVEQDGLASSVSVDLLPGRATGIFAMQASLNAPADGAVAQVFNETLGTFIDTPIAADRLERLRTRRLTSAMRQLAALENRAARLVEGEILHGDPGWIAAEAALIGEIGEAEIRAQAHAWLSGPGFDLLVDRIDPAASATGQSLSPPTVGAPDRLSVSAPDWVEQPLKSGARLLVSRRVGDALFQFRAISALGQDAEPQGLEGIAVLAASIPAFGAGPHDGPAFSDRMGRAGLATSMGATPSAIHLDISGPVPSLEAAAAVVSDVLLRPRYGTPDYDRQFANLVAGAASGAALPQRRAYLALQRDLLGPAHRAAVAAILPDLSAARVLDALGGFHADLWRPDGVTFLLAGDVDPAVAAALFDRLLDGWTAAASPAPTPRLDRAPARPGLRLIHAPAAESASLTLAWIAAPTGEGDLLALRCLVHVLAGSFTSRANRLLREERGLTYGVQAAVDELQPGAGPAKSSIYLAFHPDRVGDVAVAIAGLVDAIHLSDPISEAEIEGFRHGERQRLGRLNESGAQAVGAMHEMVNHGMDGSAGWIDYRDRVEALDEAALADAVARFLPRAHALTASLVGDIDRLRPGLAAVAPVIALLDEGAD